MTGVDICSHHYCFLQNSTVQISSKPSPSLDYAEECVPPAVDVVYCDVEQLCKIVEYVHMPFHLEMELHGILPQKHCKKNMSKRKET